MWTRQHKQTRKGRLIIPALAAGFVSYFGYHAYHGELGIYASKDYEAQIFALQGQLAEAKGRREAMEKRLHLIEDGTLDKDMLDEQARRALDLTQADEITIMRPREGSD